MTHFSGRLMGQDRFGGSEPRRWRRRVVAGGFLAGALSMSPAALSEVTFPGGWESGALIGPGLWSKAQVVRDDSMSLVEDVVRQGRFAARIEIRPGDNPLRCCAGSERAEVTDMTRPDGTPIRENAGSGTQYVGLSVRLPKDWPEPEWSSFIQLHGPDEYDAAASFALRVNAGRFVADLFAGDVGVPFGSHYDIGPATEGIWVDFILRIDFAVGKTGSVAVWRRDEGQEAFTQALGVTGVATLQSRDGVAGDHYWKAGFYRAAAKDTSVVWLDGVTRADTLDELVATAFAPAASPPPSGFRFSIKPSDMAVKTVGDRIDNGGWVLFANGEVAHKVKLPKSGAYDIEVVARGTRAGDTWPIMILAIDGEPQRALIVDSEVSRPYVSSFKNIAAGERDVSLIFVNDGLHGEEDRNLYLDMVTIRGAP